MEKPLFVFAKFHAKKDKVEELKQLLRKFIAETLENEPGCISYNYLQSTENETLFTSAEVWQDAEAETAHWETKHLKDLLVSLPELVDGEADVIKYHRI